MKLTKQILQRLIKEEFKNVLNETKFFNYYTKIEGTVGHHSNTKYVTAYEYYGADSNLSHYRIDGKTYMGTVEFTEITKKTRIKY